MISGQVVTGALLIVAAAAAYAPGKSQDNAFTAGQTQDKADEQSKPASAETKSEATAEAGVLKLDGITFQVLRRWKAQEIKPGPFAAKAAYSLMDVNGKDTGCSVRITHYPSMKGKDRMNIQRWIASVAKPDGTPNTRDETVVTIYDKKTLRLKVVDLTGTVGSGKGDGDAGKKNHRLIAAVVDHPKGPHFVKWVGPAPAMAKVYDEINAFLQSATVVD